MPRIAFIPGDGIGTEVAPQARRVLEAVARAEGLDFQVTDWGPGGPGAERLPASQDDLRSLAAEHDAALVGALDDPDAVPAGGHARAALESLRSRWDLYLGFRPCVLLAPELCPLKRFKVPVRLEVFGESTEGSSVGVGGAIGKGTCHEVAVEEDVTTRPGVERIVRAALDFARVKGRARVTMVGGAEGVRHAGDPWRRAFAEVGEEFPEVERDVVRVDDLAADLVRRPERYAVLVAPGLLGDVVSALAAELTGGLGLAPRADIHPGRKAVFGPVRGWAAGMAGKGKVNPFSAVRCVGLLLDHFGHTAAGERVERAVAAAIAEGKTTPDMGGSFSTETVGAWLAERVAGDAADEKGTRT